ncbi:MAG: hypothetical protein ACJ77E_10275 [Gaiellaceae bacterium]
MATAAATQRRGSTRASKKAGKQRRQTIVVGVLAVFLAVLLAYEVPHTLKMFKSSSSAAPAAPTAPPTSASAATQREARTLRGSRTGADPFAAKSLPNGDAQPAAAGGPDPFTAPASRSAAASPAPAAAPPAPAPAALPKQIVIGRPGGHRVATHGWIVILASIPTSEGQRAAQRFARGARGNVGALSVLNSSNRRPLRGGYWVVYTGPYPTLGAVSRRAGNVHAAGYRTAYIRELITYR